MLRAFRFAASERFSWSVERSRVVARSSVHMFMESVRSARSFGDPEEEEGPQPFDQRPMVWIRS